MLVLSRRNGEEILVGDHVVIKVLSLARGKVQVGIEAPPEVSIKRSELVETRHERRVNHRWDSAEQTHALVGAAH